MGEEITMDSDAWGRISPAPQVVVEICLQGSSVGFGTEEWFAVLVTDTYQQPNGTWTLVGFLVGSENETVVEEVHALLADGGVHLCREDPCPDDFPSFIHATRVRWWPVERFEAEYVTAEGKSKLAKARKEMELKRKKEEKERVAEEKKKKKAEDQGGKTRSGFKPGAKPAARGGAPKTERKLREPALRKGASQEVVVISDGEEEEDLFDDDAQEAPAGAGMDRAQLRKLLANTKSRILGGAFKSQRAKGAPPGGSKPKGTRPAVQERGLTSGACLNPNRASMLALEDAEDTRDSGLNKWMTKTVKKNDMGSLLLAQAVQNAEESKKRKKKDKKSGLAETLVKLLTDKSDKAKKKKKKKRKKEKGVKEEPGGPGGSDDEDSDEDSSSGEDGDEAEKDEESDSSFEAPLRRRAARRPGSVMEMLVKHAQEQLDQGALLDDAGKASMVTQGVKLTTYFGLLIRPYHQGNSPLVRELYALAQTIDQLRAGRLPQAADSLAARFVACHTALTEGNWQVASQLEMFPLEATQSASTSTMLKAHKHRRLVLKSQGYPQGWNWSGGGRGKGGYQQEKGKKGEPKGKGKGKGRGKGKDAAWGQTGKGENNPWKENKEEAAKK